MCVYMMKLGSLFDGSGGFPLAGALNGITPVWASEIEPYPIAVTRSRFPCMKHLGNVTEIHGGEIPPVDVITFGSPCQDLSIAGKRAGIHEGKRSNLFFEAIRIIKEMREATNGTYPKYAVWENVQGAFSSNGGEDFRQVLESFCQIKNQGISIPRPANGKFKRAGEIVGDNFSLAWRQLDAQHWGVPQRRKRIYLVADFTGERAGEILFEREGLRGHLAPSGASGEDAADDAARCTGGSRDVKCLNPWDSQSYRQYEADGVYPALQAHQGGRYEGACYALDSMSSNSMKSSNPRSGFHEETIAKTLQAGGVDPTCNQGGNVIVEPVYALQGNGIDRPAISVFRNLQFSTYAQDTTFSTLNARDYKDASDLCVQTVSKQQRKYIIRRLTPLECCRLQGFPDGWGVPDHKDRLSDEELAFWQQVRDTCASIGGKPTKNYSAEVLTKWYNGLHTDSAEYKMWGNGIALLCAEFVLKGIAEELRRERE